MSMRGIDIASYQAALNLNNIAYDFVAIKATEGLSYVNPYCDIHFQQAKAAGKKRAVYHFIDFTVDIIAQADHFVDNCAGYIRDAIFVLDWEGTNVERVGDALRFLQHVEQRIGYKPAIYMSEWVENNYDWSAVVNNDNGLWAAKYSNWELYNHAHDWDMANAGVPPNTVYWDFYFMWQWTSTGLISGYAGNLDCDIAYIDQSAWDKYAGVQATPTPHVPAITYQDVTETKTVPFDRLTTFDDTKDVGFNQVTQAGVAGTETIVTTIAFTDGAETGRAVKSDSVTTAPVTEITTIGSKKPVPVVDPPVVDPIPSPTPTPTATEPWWKPILRSVLAAFGIII